MATNQLANDDQAMICQPATKPGIIQATDIRGSVIMATSINEIEMWPMTRQTYDNGVLINDVTVTSGMADLQWRKPTTMVS